MAPFSKPDRGAEPSSLTRFMDWWSAELARPDAKPATRLWKAVFLSDPAGLRVFLRQGSDMTDQGTLTPTTSDAEWTMMAHKLIRRGVTRGSVLLLLAERDVISRRLQLPTGVRDVLRAVVGNRIEAVAPFHADQALYDCREAGVTPDGSNIDVDLWVAPRAKVERWLAAMTRAGLEPSAVDVGNHPSQTQGVNLISNSHDGALRRAQIKKRLATGFAAAAVLATLSLGWMAYRTSVATGLERQAQQALAQAKRANDTETDSRKKAAAQAVAQRLERPVMSVMLEVLSRVLPDQAALERLEVRDGTVILSGKAADAPSLIALVEASPHFKNVEFASPTTRDETSNRSNFSISAKIAPHILVNPR